jgi:ribosome-associated protein
VADDDSNPTTDALRLDQFLKLKAIAGTGGQAKVMIQNGEVKVNGETETRRRRKLSAGDVVEIGDTQVVVE